MRQSEKRTVVKEFLNSDSPFTLSCKRPRRDTRSTSPYLSDRDPRTFYKRNGPTMITDNLTDYTQRNRTSIRRPPVNNMDENKSTEVTPGFLRGTNVLGLLFTVDPESSPCLLASTLVGEGHLIRKERLITTVNTVLYVVCLSTRDLSFSHEWTDLFTGTGLVK